MSAGDRDLPDIARGVCASGELGAGWFPALDRSRPYAAYIGHADGRELRLAHSRRDSGRLAVQGMLLTSREHRPVGKPITVTLGSSDRVIARHAARRLLPAYTERFAAEMALARQLDQQAAVRDRFVAALERLGGRLDTAGSAAGRMRVDFPALPAGAAAWIELGGETELRLRVSGGTAVRVMRIVAGREEPELE